MPTLRFSLPLFVLTVSPGSLLPQSWSTLLPARSPCCCCCFCCCLCRRRCTAKKTTLKFATSQSHFQTVSLSSNRCSASVPSLRIPVRRDVWNAPGFSPQRFLKLFWKNSTHEGPIRRQLTHAYARNRTHRFRDCAVTDNGNIPDQKSLQQRQRNKRKNSTPSTGPLCSIAPHAKFSRELAREREREKERERERGSETKCEQTCRNSAASC